MTGKFMATIPRVIMVLLFNCLVSFGQTHNVTLLPGKKVVLQGQVRAGNYREQLYTFEATAKQRLDVHLTSVNHNAVFSINEQYRVDRQPFEEEKTEWSGSLPESESHGLYSIAVTATRGTAVYTLEITLHVSHPVNRVDEAQSDNPLNIKDYYLLMPEKYDRSTRTEREEILESTETFVDVKNGYIGSQIGKLGERCQVALFKSPDSGFILAYNEDGDPQVNVPTKLYLLKYEGGQWVDVTTELLPVPVNVRYHYDLPQIGTTIKVTTAKGNRVYELAWKNGKFEKA